MSIQDFETLELVRIVKKRETSWDRERSDRAFEQLATSFDTDLKKFASRFYISGSDPQDVLQECRWGLFKAALDFEEDGGMSFRNWAFNLCIKRHVITAMAAANRMKFSHHNNSVSLDTPISTGDDDAEQSLSDFIQDSTMSLLDYFLIHEEYSRFCRELESVLTPLELTIFKAYGLNESYKDMAEITGYTAKTVDNALMRIRKKAIEVRLRLEAEESEEIDRLAQLKLAVDQAISINYALIAPSKPILKESSSRAPMNCLNAKSTALDDMQRVIDPILLKVDTYRLQYADLDEGEFITFLSTKLRPLEEAIYLAFYSGESQDEIKAIMNDSFLDPKPTNKMKKD